MARARWVVSVEGLGVPARAAVLKSLQHRLGLVMADNDRHEAQPFGWLLHRMHGLTKVPPRADALWCGSWLMHVPSHAPALARLHRDLAAVLADLVPGGPRGTRHLMVWLDADPHEAFDAVLHCPEVSSSVREVGLQSLREAQEAITRAVNDAAAGDQAGLSSPFDVQIVRVPCPPFAADNPVTLHKLLDLVEDGCLKAMRG